MGGVFSQGPGGRAKFVVQIPELTLCVGAFTKVWATAKNVSFANLQILDPHTLG